MNSEAGRKANVFLCERGAAVLQENVRAWCIFCVKPGIVKSCGFCRQSVILEVVLADEDVSAVGREKMEGTRRLVIVLSLRLFVEIASSDQLIVNLINFSKTFGCDE